MTHKLTIQDLQFKNEKALIRVDFNVPIENGVIRDDTRIRAALPTLKYVLDKGGAIILLSHLGRPDGKYDPQLSLKPCAERLATLLDRPVQMAPNSVGEEVRKLADRLKPGQILLLENLRFYEAEEKPEVDPNFVKNLASLGDLYINDAFGAAHRAHASTTHLAHYFPGQAAAGCLMMKEIKYFETVLFNPKRPFYAILGGAKISSKFKILRVLKQKADALFIGGAMAFTFYKAQGLEVGDSLVENEYLVLAKELLEDTHKHRCPIHLPTDIVAVREQEIITVDIANGIPTGFKGVDIGKNTIQNYSEAIKDGKTIFWNGPMGIFETPPFNAGTNGIANALAELQNASTIVGGGDSIAALEASGVIDRISHVSTGGGAALEYIELGRLPGIDALSDKIN